MIHKLNPMIIGGYDILLLGKKGFTSLARASKIKIRPKGSKEPWVEVSLKGKRKLAERKKLLTKAIFKLSKKKDEAAEKAIRAEKKKAKKVPKEISFTLADTSEKIVKTRDGRLIDTRKYFFQTPRSYEFVEAKDMDVTLVNQYVEAVKQEFLNEVYPKHGKAEYLIRFYHDYKGLPSTSQSDPLDKGFGGMSINRQVMDKSDVKEQFGIMEEIYIDAFAKYLQFARSDTYFRFTGFTAEVVLDTYESMGEEIIPRPKKKRKKKKKPTNRSISSLR